MISRADLGEGGGDRGLVVLEPRIGGEGDFVERGHELGDEDLGEEQAGRVDAQHMRIEQPAGDEDVGLALREPEELAGAPSRRHSGQCRRRREKSKLGHRNERAAIVMPIARSEEQCDRRGNQRPYPPRRQAPRRKCRDRPGERRDEVDQRLSAEVHRAREQRLGQGDEGVAMYRSACTRSRSATMGWR